MLVTQVYSLPPQAPCLSLPGLLQGEMLESRSKHGPSQGPEAGGCVWGSPIRSPSPPQLCSFPTSLQFPHSGKWPLALEAKIYSPSEPSSNAPSSRKAFLMLYS